MRAGLGRLIAAAALVMSAAGPALAEPRAIALQPGSGIVKRSPPPRRRDGARQAEAQAKRERKNAKRLRDWRRCHVGSRIKTSYPFAEGVNHGE